MEQNKEAVVHNEDLEPAVDDIGYDELMEHIREVLGEDLSTEGPTAPEAAPEAAPAEASAEEAGAAPAEGPEEAPAAVPAEPEEAPVPQTAPEEEPMAEQNQPPQENTPEPAPKGGKKAFWALLVAAVLLVGGYLGLCAYADSLTTFYPGRHINGVAVGGMTVAQAQTALEAGLSERTIALTDESGEALAVVALMDLGYDAEDFAGDAQFWLEGQQMEGFLSKGWTFINILLGNYPGGASWPDADGAERAETLEKLADALYQAPVHAAYELGEGVLRITKARDGRTLNVAAMTAALEDTALYGGGGETPLVFDLLPADTFTAQELHDTVSGVMKNASYDIENDAILSEQVGVEFNVAAAQAALNGAEPGSTVEVEAAVEHPAVTAAELETVLFRDVLGEYRTHVSGTAARINNVKLSAATINGYVMNAGDVFSYNTAVGQRTAANGYQAAPAYIRGETVDEIGGGICQTSSTLYYACLLAQVEIVERYPHRYVPAYIPWGMDATVSWGGPDYLFANNSDYPIKIVTEYAKNYLTVKILGTRTLDTTVKMTNEVVSTTPWVTVYEVDETLAPGTPETEKTSPYTGYKVKAYRHVYDKDGKLLSTTLESTNDYKVRNQVIVQAPPAPAEQVPVVTDPVTGAVDVVQPEGGQPPAEAPEQTVPPAEETPAPGQSADSAAPVETVPAEP